MDPCSVTKTSTLERSDDHKRRRPSKSDVGFAKRPRLEECVPQLSFLSLPPEIRNMIYRHLGRVKTHNIRIVGRGINFHYEPAFNFQLQRHRFRGALHPRCTTKFDTAIASTCRLIHQETRAVLYGRLFFLPRMEDAASWLLNIGPQNRALLRGIRLTTRVKDTHPACSYDYVATDRDRYRQVSKLVSGLLANSSGLECLGFQYLFNPSNPPILSHAREEWINKAYRIAEELYVDFQSFFAEALARGRRPSQMCDIVHINWEIFQDREWMSLETEDNRLEDSQTVDAMNAFGDHLNWLLELHSKGLGHPSPSSSSLSSIKVGMNICRYLQQSTAISCEAGQRSVPHRNPTRNLRRRGSRRTISNTQSLKEG
ncbi:hypothetical protein K456DRAFT_1759620 [Colletotrichum gloeosporioides 23]|nr:hypothetical protein K456DRAFT_1759620 [Colletotrichum gloeosporioides 23]